eukprot:119890_1
MTLKLLFFASICILCLHDHCGIAMASNNSTTTTSPITNTSSSSPSTLPTLPSTSPSNVPSTSPSNVPSTSPSHSLTNSPSRVPSAAPTSTASPTATPSTPPTTIHPVYTTTIGPKIHATQRLEVNFTLNFRSISGTFITPNSVNDSFNFAYGLVGIPVNYIDNVIHLEHDDDGYMCRILSRIDAQDKGVAAVYETLIGADMDDDTSSKFAMVLKQTLDADPDSFDISVPVMDIVPFDPSPDSSSSDGDDTASIIIWFLGVSAVCAVGALFLIVCWRKFSAKEDSAQDEENKNAINLEFLLDPNATMHLSNDPVLDIEHAQPEPRRLEETEAQPTQMQQSHKQEEEEEEEAFSSPLDVLMNEGIITLRISMDQAVNGISLMVRIASNVCCNT